IRVDSKLRQEAIRQPREVVVTTQARRVLRLETAHALFVLSMRVAEGAVERQVLNRDVGCLELHAAVLLLAAIEYEGTRWRRKTQHLQMFAILIERSGVEAQ